jgi:hypothetical protein
LDAYGVIDEDGAGKDWEYTNGHAVRRRGVTAPNDTWSVSEWVVTREVDYTNLTPRAHAEDVTWQGSSSDNWNERGTNWSGTYGYVPDGSYNVSIPVTGTDPMVNEPSACNTLNVANGAGLGIGASGDLDVAGEN